MRSARRTRTTKETSVEIALCLDGRGEAEIRTGIRFFDHMLQQWCFHSGSDLAASAQSFDGIAHHVIEDVGLTLGEAVAGAVGDKRSITRYGACLLPMDDALARAALDFSGRPYARVNAPLSVERIEDLDAQMIGHFFASLAQTAGVTLHVDLLEGANAHHAVEAIFKAVARAFGQAWRIEAGAAAGVPSTKGVL